MTMTSVLKTNNRYLHVRRPFQVGLLVAIVLAIYAPSIFGEICSIDDLNMIQTLRKSTSSDLLSSFFPQAKSGAYYRPLISISFQLDFILFNLFEGFMKFENVFFHIINVFLVYWLTFQLIPREKQDTSLVPLISALLFGLNPVNTESVNWISGRTDLMACSFVLLSANCLIKFKNTHKYLFAGLSVIFLVFGFFSKEVSIVFALGAILILSAEDSIFPGAVSSTVPTAPPAKGSSRGWLFIVLLVGAAATIIELRQSSLTSGNDKLALTLNIIFSDIPYATFVIMNALVFYLKKIFIPFPLNFSIIEPEPLYDLLGLPTLLFCIYLVAKRKLIAAVFMTGVIMITPAFLPAFRQIAWTAYAERYVYIASSFIIMSAVLYGAEMLKQNPRFIGYTRIAVGILLLIATYGTLHRNIIWMHNITLYKDTVDKSPRNFLTRTGYGYCLANAGDLQNARAQFVLANKQEGNRKMFSSATPYLRSQFGYAEDADIGLAFILEKEGKLIPAAEAYELILKKKEGRSEIALDRLVQLYEYLLSISSTAPNAAFYKKKLLFFTGNEYNYSKAEILYGIGKTLFVRRDFKDAEVFFTRASEHFGKNEQYKIITQKMIFHSRSMHDPSLHTIAEAPSVD